MTDLRAHDLIRISRAHGVLNEHTPPWARRSVAKVPWVVVRREKTTGTGVPIGIRGPTRAQRHGTIVARDAIRQIVTPESLAGENPQTAASGLAVWRALKFVRPCLDATGLAWGPTGSAGYELTTRVATATHNSDLDVIVRLPILTAAVLATLYQLQAELTEAPATIDCQLDTPRGAISLAELTACDNDVLVRTPTGPTLVNVSIDLLR